MTGINGIAAESLAEASSIWLMVLVDAALKGLIVLLVAAIAARWMRRASAATRHLVWLFAALSLFVLPVLSVTLPEWNVLPSWMGWPSSDASVSVTQTDQSPDPPDDPEIADTGIPTSWDRPRETESHSDADISGVFAPALEQPESLQPQEHEAAAPLADSNDTVADSLSVVTSAIPQPTPGSAFPWQAAVLMSWAAGSLIAVLPVVLGGLSLWRLKRSAIAACETHLTTVFRHAVPELGIRRNVTLLLSDRRLVPMQWGTWRPILLLPDSAHEWSPDRLRAVFLHELAHVRRNDCLVRMLVHLLCAVYWFNPLMWIARRRLQVESEAACDDLVIRAGYEPRDYAQHLLEVVTGLRRTRLAGAAAMAMASRSKLETRMVAILDRSRNRRSVTRLVAMAVLVCLLGLTVPLAMLHEASVGASAEASVESDSKVRKEKAEKFIHLLLEREFREAVGLFDPTLFPALPYVELVRIWDEFEKRCGSFRGAISYAERDFPNGRLLEVRGRWDEAVMLIRLAFDEENRIAGFWLARDRKGPTPEHFRHGGYMFGTATERIVGLDHSLTVRVLDADGEPLKEASATLWKQVVGTPDKKQSTWDDPETGALWTRYTDGYGFRDDRDKTRSGWRRLPSGVYRVTATHANQPNDPCRGTGQPVRLDETQKTAETAVKLRDGPSLVVRVIDAKSGEPIESAAVSVRSKESRSPRSGWIKLRAVDGEYRRDNLPPGPYGLHVSKPSYFPHEPKYVTDVEEIDVEIVAGKDHEITVKVKPVPLTQEEIDRRWPWIAEGTVTDADGNPLEGVGIWAYVGRGGTIQGRGPATTNARGHYTLRFGIGGLRRSNPPGDPPLRMQSGSLAAWKDGYVERNLDRHTGMIVADRKPKEEDWQNYDYIRRDDKRVVLPGKPRRIDFVMVRELAISGRLVDQSNEPIRNLRLRVTDETTLAQNSLRRFTTDDEGRFSLNRIPPDHTWWFRLVPPETDWTIQSLPLRFARSGKYEMLLRLVRDEATGIRYLQLAGLTDAEGNERREEVVGDAPLGRPPVEPKMQAKGREILAQVAEANRYWLGLPPKEVRSYRYTLTAMGDGPGRGTRQYEVRDDSGESFPAKEMEATHAKRHGITYFSALHYLTAHAEDVSFRQVEFDEDEIRLAYFFKNRVWFAASYCLFASRNGFHLSFSDIREGTVVLDRKTLTPREHLTPWFRETFSDYVEIQPDHYAPMKVRFNRFDYQRPPVVQWGFKVYKPGLWLFDTDRHASKDGDTKIMALIDNVKVNGKPAELMFAPEGQDTAEILRELKQDVGELREKLREMQKQRNSAFRDVVELTDRLHSRELRLRELSHQLKMQRHAKEGAVESQPSLVDERFLFVPEDAGNTGWPTMQLSPDGRKLLYARGGSAVLRDLDTGAETPSPIGAVGVLASLYGTFSMFDPTGEKLALLKFTGEGEEGGSEQDCQMFLWTRPWSETKPSLVVSGGFAKFDGTGERLVVHQEGDRMAVAKSPEYKPKPLAVHGINWSACPASDMICILTVSMDASGRGPRSVSRHRLVLYDIEEDKEVAQLPLGRGDALDDLESKWTSNGRYVYYADGVYYAGRGGGSRVWDGLTRREVGRAPADFPIGPGPTETTMVLKRHPKTSREEDWGIVLHDAATGRSWTLGDTNYNLQAAAGGRVVYLKHLPDGEASVYAAQVHWPSG